MLRPYRAYLRRRQNLVLSPKGLRVSDEPKGLLPSWLPRPKGLGGSDDPKGELEDLQVLLTLYRLDPKALRPRGGDDPKGELEDLQVLLTL